MKMNTLLNYPGAKWGMDLIAMVDISAVICAHMSQSEKG